MLFMKTRFRPFLSPFKANFILIMVELLLFAEERGELGDEAAKNRA